MKSTRCPRGEQGTYRSQLNFDNATKLLLFESAMYAATAMLDNRFAVSSMAAIIIPRPALLTLVTRQHPIKMLINLNGTIRPPGKFKTKKNKINKKLELPQTWCNSPPQISLQTRILEFNLFKTYELPTHPLLKKNGVNSSRFAQY